VVVFWYSHELVDASMDGDMLGKVHCPHREGNYETELTKWLYSKTRAVGRG